MHFKRENFDLFSHPGHMYEPPAVAMFEGFKVLQILKYFGISPPNIVCFTFR